MSASATVNEQSPSVQDINLSPVSSNSIDAYTESVSPSSEFTSAAVTLRSKFSPFSTAAPSDKVGASLIVIERPLYVEPVSSSLLGVKVIDCAEDAHGTGDVTENSIPFLHASLSTPEFVRLPLFSPTVKSIFGVPVPERSKTQ